MTTRPARKAIPTPIKLQLVIDQNGFCGCGCGVRMNAKKEGIEFQHQPPLRSRAVNQAGDDYDPPQLDPRYISAQRKPCHRKLTRTADKVTIRKAKARHEPKNKPKTPIQSRGFDKKLTRGFDGKVRNRETGETI